MESPEGRIRVEVAYAGSQHQVLVACEIRASATLGEAIEASGVLLQYPEIDLTQNRVGVFGRLKSLDSCLQAGDRVEIYRPLQVDPKEVRRRRAARRSA